MEADERILKRWFSDLGTVCDLNCGMGSMIRSLPQFEFYYGFDEYLPSIHIARKDFASYNNVEFCTVDIFKFQSDIPYNTLLCLSTLMTHPNPELAIKNLMRLWKADNYVFAVKVSEVGGLSTKQYENLTDHFDVVQTCMHMQNLQDKHHRALVHIRS